MCLRMCSEEIVHVQPKRFLTFSEAEGRHNNQRSSPSLKIPLYMSYIYFQYTYLYIIMLKITNTKAHRLYGTERAAGK